MPLGVRDGVGWAGPHERSAHPRAAHVPSPLPLFAGGQIATHPARTLARGFPTPPEAHVCIVSSPPWERQTLIVLRRATKRWPCATVLAI